MKSSRQRFSTIHSDFQRRKRMRAERRSFVSTALLICKKKHKRKLIFKFLIFILYLNFILAGWLVTWLPYAMIAMYSTFAKYNKIHPLYATLPSLFAKLSLVWPALLTIFYNKDVRNKLKMIKHSLITKNEPNQEAI